MFENFFDTPIVKIAVIVVVAIIVQRISGGLISTLIGRTLRRHPKETATDHKKRANTLTHVFKTAADLVIWVVAIASILTVLKVNLASIATGAGFLGIVVGLGAQATIRDYLAGIFILIENQYRVGDIVTLSGGATGGGTSGVVEEITLRITKLRDLDGTLNIIRNGEATVITNRTFDYSSVVLDISVAYDTDIDAAERVINQVGNQLLADPTFHDEFNEPIQFLRVDRFAESAVILKAVGKVKPASQWGIAGEYRRRLLKAFAKENIAIALPQLVIHRK